MDIRCGGVLFDSDGVLVDSTRGAEEAWARWARGYELDPAAVLEGVHGRRSSDTVALHLPPDARDAALRRIEEIEIASAASTSAVPGAGQLIATLGARWAVVTSATEPLFLARLAAAGLPTPPVAVTARDVTDGKPAPDGYLAAADRLGLPASQCVVLEDSATGVRAGLAAGAAHVVGVGEGALVTDAPTVVRTLEGARWAGGVLHLPARGLLRRGVSAADR